MGELINITGQFSDSQIPQMIARDTEYIGADKAHADAEDPHEQYRRKNSTETFTPAIKAICISQGSPAATGNFAGYSGLEIRSDQNVPNSGAFIWFNRPGVYGAHLGFDSTNQLGTGGGSAGANFYRIFHEGNPITARAPLPPATVAGGSAGIGWNSATGAAEFCAYAGTGAGEAYSFFRLPGSTGGVPTLSNKISRIDTSGAYLQVSDKRLKSSHTKAPGLSAILALEPLKYKHWESLEAASQASMLGENFQYKIGFFAQDVEKILPEAVQQPSGPEDLYAMDYNCILACAIQAIKELADQVFHLESRLSKGFKD